jgi:hypothetical protein
MTSPGGAAHPENPFCNNANALIAGAQKKLSAEHDYPSLNGQALEKMIIPRAEIPKRSEGSFNLSR